MALIMRASASGGLVHIRPGLYDAVVTGVRPDNLPGTFGTGDVIRITCRLADVVDEGGDPVHIDGIANAKLTTMSKLWSWLEALGLHLETDFDVDIEQVVGKQCVLSVVDAISKQDGTTYSKVDAIYAPRRQAMAAEGLLSPTGDINWTAFYAEAQRRHITKDMIAGALGGDINVIGTKDPSVVLQLLEDLRGI